MTGRTLEKMMLLTITLTLCGTALTACVYLVS